MKTLNATILAVVIFLSAAFAVFAVAPQSAEACGPYGSPEQMIEMRMAWADQDLQLATEILEDAKKSGDRAAIRAARRDVVNVAAHRVQVAKQLKAFRAEQAKADAQAKGEAKAQASLVSP